MLENYLAMPSEIGLCSAIPLKAFSVLKFIVTQGSGVPWCSLFPAYLSEVSLFVWTVYSEKQCFWVFLISPQTYSTKEALDKVSGPLPEMWLSGFGLQKQLVQKYLKAFGNEFRVRQKCKNVKTLRICRPGLNLPSVLNSFCSPLSHIRKCLWDSPAGPVVKALSSQCRGHRFNPSSGS